MISRSSWLPRTPQVIGALLHPGSTQNTELFWIARSVAGAVAFMTGKHYTIRNYEAFADSASISPALTSLEVSLEVSSLSFSQIKPLVASADDDIKMVESAARRQLQVSSTLDWKCATAGKFISDLIPDGDEEPVVGTSISGPLDVSLHLPAEEDDCSPCYRHVAEATCSAT